METSMTTELDKEIAEKVILPKLKMLAIADSNDEIKSIASLRRHFNEKFEESISAAKFQSWIDLLGIKFEKKVVIIWPTPGGPSGPPVVAPEDPEVDDEMNSSFPPTAPMNVDAFGLLQ